MQTRTRTSLQLRFKHTIFERLLKKYQVEYVVLPEIRLPGPIYYYIQPDFLLTKDNILCEVVENSKNFWYRAEQIAYTIKEGYKFTFYNINGEKIIFTTKMLTRIGIKDNAELYVIKQLPQKVTTLSGRIFVPTKVYYADYQKTKEEIMKLSTEGNTQQEIGEKLNISQPQVSKILAEIKSTNGNIAAPGNPHEILVDN